MPPNTPTLPLNESPELTISEALDFNLENNPNELFYVFSPKSGKANVTITHLEFSRAAHRAAHIVRPHREGADGRVVVVLALVDTITYQATTAGLMKAGLIPFPISPRLSPAAIVHLLQKVSSHEILATQHTLSDLIDGIKLEIAKSNPSFELLVRETPSVHDLYPKLGTETISDHFDLYPLPNKRPELLDTTLYLHSSGSTGFPKAIPETHKALMDWALFACTALSLHKPRIRTSALALPSFHTLGITCQLIQPLYALICVAIYPPTVLSPNDQPIIPTSDNILDHLLRTECNALMTIPAILHTWAPSEEAVDLLKSLIFVGYSGGPLAERLGDALANSGVNIKAIYGATEFGAPTLPQLERGHEEDWEWMEFNPRANIRWVDQGDETYECQFLTCETHHPAVENMDNPRGYATSDLFQKHPTKPNLWKIVGRKDDVIMHSSGEKTVPGPMEEIISSSSMVKGVVMFGREHDQAGVLIEATPAHAIDTRNLDQLANLRNKLWPFIEEANRGAPAFSRIYKEMVLVASTQKPLPRSAKGTVLKKEALRVYAEEVEDLYKVVESSQGGENITPPENWEEETVKQWILDQAQDIVPSKELSSSKDLFEQGFDSLSATFLRLRISGALRSVKDLGPAASSLAQNIIYTHSSIDALAAFIVGMVTNPTDAGGPDGTDQAGMIEKMIEKYSSSLDKPITPVNLSTGNTKGAVLITGSTGNLGAEILANLLQNDLEDIEKIFVLNRPSTGAQTILDRHKLRFEDKGFDLRLLESPKIAFIESDIAEERLGMNPALYGELLNSVTIIIHVAWRLDFNLMLPSFESNIRGTRNLIDLARSSPRASSIRYVFTSSVTSAQSWDQEKGLYPETVVDDAKYAVGGGYGEGKYVAERILAKSGLHACSLRIGQVSGGLPNGAWAVSDWVPILVKSSLALGALPGSSEDVSWIPMDAVCQAIVDIAFTAEVPPLALNLVHPQPVPWNDIFRAIATSLGDVKHEAPLSLIPIRDWVARLDKVATSTEGDMQKIPAIKLLDFFRKISTSKPGKNNDESGGYSGFETKSAQRVSETMSNLKAIGVDDAKRWIGYWDRCGLFD